MKLFVEKKIFFHDNFSKWKRSWLPEVEVMYFASLLNVFKKNHIKHLLQILPNEKNIYQFAQSYLL